MKRFKVFIASLREMINESQEHTSSGTSIPQASAGLKYAVKKNLIRSNSVNVDSGGGKYDLGKEHVESNVSGAKLHVHDPFNRSEEHNTAIEKVATGRSDYVGSHNVLNVIKEPDHREAALHKIKSFMKPKTGIAHITVYDGDKNGVGRITKKQKTGETSWQNNKRVEDYLPEIEKVFPSETHDVSRQGKHILIRQRSE